MRLRGMCGVFALFATIIVSNPTRGQDDDPVIGNAKLSKLVEAFKAAKSADARSDLAFAIAMGKEKAASAVPLLAAALKDEDRIVRENVAMALRAMGPAAKAAVPNLTAALKDTHPPVRVAAAGTLGVIGADARTAVPALLASLKNAAEPAEVRAASADALAGIGAEPKLVTPALKGAIADEDVRLRLACASSLYRFDKANAKLSLPVLRAGLKDRDAQMDAVLRMKVLGSDAKEAIPDLIALVKEGGIGGYYAPEALGAIPEAEAALLTALKSPDAGTQQAAATALPKAFPEAAKKAGLVK